ncbi:MAG: tRNA 2-thiouridine(34) synthase MnmA [Candidatus Aminicenantaceae bacterium]
MRRKKVVVAMSGGVDSSVAAALLKEQDYEVTGITMNLFSLPDKYCRDENLRSCCGWRAVEDANRVAAALRIPHYVVDFRKQFEDKVIKDFCEEYVQGHTPNPCICCNQYIKFDLLMKRAKRLKADYVATGHHARVEYDSHSGRYILKKGKDEEKDQSYFLYVLTQKQLSRTLMPIGYFTKEEVRKKAHKLGLPVAKRPESQEICFIPDNDYAQFLTKRIPETPRPGPIVNLDNQILGNHKGIIHYTIGQRRGIGIAASYPLYVLSIEPDKNTIVVGPNNQLYKRKLIASRVNLIAVERVVKPLKLRAKIRYKHEEKEALLRPLSEGNFQVEFKNPQRAVTPGQAVVFYDGDVVFGGGVIE